MAERKSLADAMVMSPEKLAFIKQGTAGNIQTEPVPQPEKLQTIELQVPGPDESSKQPKVKSPKPQSRVRASREEQPNANAILDQVLVPVTIRLQHRTTQALRRAYLEQRLKHAKPDTQQEIVEIALVEWLSTHGFLEES